MNNLLSYCGLTGAWMRASEKDLYVLLKISAFLKIYPKFEVKIGSSTHTATFSLREKACEMTRFTSEF